MEGKEMKENVSELNMTELMLKISTDVAEIKSDMSNFKDAYKTEKENLLSKIDDVRKDYEKDIAQHDAEIKQLNVYIEAVRTAKDKEDAKKWRTVIAFILTGLGGMLLSRLPDFLLLIAKSAIGGQ